MSAPEWKLRAIEVAGSAVLSVLGATIRFDVRGDEELREIKDRGGSVIYSLWHSDLLPLAHLHRNQGIVVLVSQHRDGEYIARVIGRRGFDTVRGSSTRGGAQGLRGLVRAARRGHDLGITPDGPKGPPREVKRGALVAAQLSGLPLIPMAAGGSRIWRLSSWDRFMIPKPFSRISVRYGAPIHVPREAGDAQLDELGARLRDEMNRLAREAGPPPDLAVREEA